MQKAVEKFRKDLGSIQVGRANAAQLDSVKVSHNGKTLPLSQVAQVNVKDANTLIIVISDDSLLNPVKKAITDANLGLTPQVAPPSGIKVVIPKLSQEYKQTIIKNISQIAEAAKTRVRSSRADARTALKRISSLTTDQNKKLEKDIQTVTDKYSAEIDTIATAKQKEIA
eukprot:jgi/Hompol1/6709/HPOL_001640-RA